ncbi:alpha-amylase [Porphyromonas macacae]|uniref:Alpha-amylase n=1 Tax=Porphyromonas macacae TaxID=28115 RepID=A0A379DFM7_9PORP|nr:alpha-amylase [Porphyromonas macacae]SUB77141.1 Alpha-amylase precursor [Porphyromonas macacae]
MNNTILQSFHWYSEGNGKHYDHIKETSDWLRDLGITSVWFPPAYKAAGGDSSVGYDPYDLFDLGEFDQKGTVATKYGTKEQYLDVCKTLQEKGIAIIADIVLNHKAGGDEKERFHVIRVDGNDQLRNVSEPFEIESFTKFTFPGRGNKYSDFKWDFTCFSGVDYAEGMEPGIFQIINEHGDGWEKILGYDKGNFNYLMHNNINHRNPFVREELNYWGKWYHEQIYFDGVRLDAIKHQSHDFYKEWLNNLRSNTGKNIFAVGEYWAPGLLSLMLDYINATEGCMSLFDACLQQNFHIASKSGDGYDLRKIFDDTLLSVRPDLSVTIVDNHDTQPLQQLEAPVEEWFKPLAYAFILLRVDGYPCVFYPDLYGASYIDKGKDGEDYEIFLNKVDGIEGLLKARKQNAYGFQRDYFEDANCVGWTREGDDVHKGCAVILSNKEEYQKPMEMGKAYAGQFFYDLLGRFEHKIQIDENGWGNFNCPAGNVSVWVPE